MKDLKDKLTAEPMDPKSLWQRIHKTKGTSSVELLSLEAAYDPERDWVIIKYQVVVLEEGVGFKSGVVGILPPGASEDDPADFQVTQLLGPIQTTDILSLAGAFVSSRWASAYAGKTLKVLIGGTTMKNGTETPFEPFSTTVTINV
jgi:hypothetical protein